MRKISTLSEQLKKRQEEELDAIEDQTQQQLHELGKRLSKHVRYELDTINEDIRESLETANITTEIAVRILIRRWLVAAGMGLAMSLGLIIGGYSLMKWMSGNLVRMEGERQEMLQTLEQLQNQTGGLRLVRAPQGRFLILPDGSKDGWTVGGHVAVKLPEG